jgi:excisionase family DNA binding protein
MAGAERLLTVSEVAKILRVSKSWIYSHVNGKAPRLPAVRIGSALRFRESSLIVFIEALEKEAQCSSK